MSIVYVGLDLGSSAFQQAAINRDGAVTMNRRFPTSEANLRTAFAGLREEIHVHLEAGELAPWAAAIIAPLVKRVVCSHPRDNAWIAKDGDKCDRVDAYKLAELLNCWIAPLLFDPPTYTGKGLSHNEAALLNVELLRHH